MQEQERAAAHAGSGAGVGRRQGGPAAAPQPSLLRAIVATYGWPYFLLGLLKAAGDALNFAGPLLLNLLLRHLAAAPGGGGGGGGGGGTTSLLGWRVDVAAPLFGYACAALLAASLLLKVGGVKGGARSSGVLGCGASRGAVPRFTAMDACCSAAPCPRPPFYLRCSFCHLLPPLWLVPKPQRPDAMPLATPPPPTTTMPHPSSRLPQAFLGAHYGYRQSLIAAQLRSAVTAAVFRKALAVNAATLAAASSGRVQVGVVGVGVKVGWWRRAGPGVDVGARRRGGVLGPFGRWLASAREPHTLPARPSLRDTRPCLDAAAAGL